ncbi:GAF and ANTAR domain-containing protein [Pseudonocardia nematodicida]|uniref:GAF and ANTAR domain-containing protein n=1 Tax=Pseudonocardia nematodicida TaxID=1206997 RepID=A0ABV1KDX3_9PSEU
MDEPSRLDLAAATLALATTGARDPSRVLGGLVDSLHRLFGVAAGAALISGGTVHSVSSAGPDGPRAAVSVGFGQGPGGDCARSGRRVVCEDLTRERTRWLAFAAKAAAAGITHAWALPIHGTADVTLGALLLLGNHDDPPDLRAAGLLAAATASAMDRAAEWESVDQERRQLHTALQSRIPIEQAKGALADRAGIDVDAAFGLLRGHARRHGLSLTEVALAVVGGEIDPAALVAGR